MKLMRGFVSTAAGLLALAMFAAAPLHAADSKIGLIDLKRVFDGYYKTKQADTQLKERVADSEKVMKGMIEDYKKAEDDYKKLMDSANDQAVSGEERERRKKNGETKFGELQEIQRSIQQFRQTTQTALEEQKRRMREEILTYLKGVISTQARKGNFTHVFDTAAESINQTPIMMYTTGQDDITEAVLTEINATAPVETKAAPDAKADAKPPK